MVTLALILQTVTKHFLFKRKTLLVCFQETYDTRITLSNTVRAMKRVLSYNSDLGEPDASSYCYSLCLVGKMRLTTTGEHKK